MSDDTLQLHATDGGVSATVVLDGAMNYALAHNGISPLRGLILENGTSEPLTGMNLEIELTGPVAGRIAEPFRSSLPEVGAGELLEIPARGARWSFDPATFAQLDEAAAASVRARFFDATRTLRAEGTMRLLARDEWWALAIRESVAAFVTPRARAIQDLISEASDLLGQRTGSPAVQGYQVGSDRAMKIATAIYDAMGARNIRYIDPAASFEGTGQKIRPPQEVLVDRWGTCLDLATTYAGALEHAGLRPVLVLCDGHAFSGHLLDEQQLPELVLRDRRLILNYVESGLFIPIETTKLCIDETRMSFDEAAHATRGWWTQGIDSVQCLIDIAAAHQVVRPLPAIAVEDGVRIVEVERAPSRAGVAPPPRTPRAPDEPTARGGERPERAYPPRVERWRSSLLDLSFRNPLLNMRTGRTSLDLHVPHGALGTLEDLMFDGRALNVIPHDQLEEIHRARGARTAQDIDPDVLEDLLGQGVLFAAITEAAYLTRLRGIARRARTVIEETGANNLFLTLGMLEWEDAGRQARAPLFLLPVTLTGRRGRPFALQIDEGGYAQPNQCLLEKLRIGHGLEIPQFRDPEGDASGIDLAGSLQAIRMALIDAQLPFTIEESAHVSLLQFSTLQLWQDLSENWESFLRNPVVRHFVETPTDSFTDPVEGAAESNGAEASAYCPIPIDGSQLQAVTWAETGRSFVLEGPPGTGKSQTITNLIANALAADKTVLFVAEKQAALDVVRRRLDKVGVGDLCLDLHGKDQTPDNMRKQLQGALHLRCTTNPESWAAVRAAHQGAVDSLGRYPVGLHELGGAGLSAWTARQALLTAGEGKEVSIPAAAVSGPLDAEALYAGARDLTQSLYDLGAGIADHPWRLARLSTDSLAGVRDQLPEAVAALQSAVTDIADDPTARLLETSDAVDAPGAVASWLTTMIETGWTLDVAAIAQASQPNWRAQVETLQRGLAALRSDSASLLSTFAPEVTIAVDLDTLLISSKTADGKLLKGRARKAVLAELSPVMQADGHVEPGALTATIEALIALRAQARDVTLQAHAVPGLTPPDGWNPLDPQARNVVESQAGAIQASVDLVERLPGATEILAAAPAGWPMSLDAGKASGLRDAWERFTGLLSASASSVTDWCGDSGSVVGAMRRHLPSWSSDAGSGALVQLGRWCHVYSRLAALEGAGLEAIARGVADGSIHPDEIESVMRRSIARAALAERLSSTALAGFDGVARDRAIAGFARTADEMRRDMVAELPAKIVSERSFSPERLVGKVGQLSRELSRKRGGLKIRELFVNYGPIIGEITPCLMMSPHSVARFLPAGAMEIDLVVFDEASQIKVAEAISAMGRGTATVVVGDSQQMPPSNIAAVTTAEDEDVQATLGIPADMESVLSEAVESNLPRLWLSWHYRSQHESLIAFSNHKYYEGRLASFPRPPEERSDLGVTWRRVDGTFERGGERVNRVEATAIVDEIRKRLASDPDASIGVVTFNTQQRDLILDLLEECADERVATALVSEGEELFVKNLENVQGDERDVILFSLAFSPNPDTGRLPLNFGPLIQAGGERRLNVAVTRARAQVVLFSSFDPAHIDLSRTASVGLAHLRSYMEAAQRHAADAGVLRPVTARDRHHDDVVHALREAGLCVRERVGLSDFTIDIAVAASEDGPWTAVFLDGPDYARRATVGDRETLPHGVLVGFMGWSRVERIWLPDWVRSPDEVIARVKRTASEPAPAELATTPSSTDRAPRPESTPEAERQTTHAYAAPVESQVDEAITIPTSVRAALSASDAEFVPAHEDFVDDLEMLDRLDFDPSCRQVVRREIDDVVAQEAPVAAARLARIVGRRFTLQRVAAKRAASILALVPATQLEQTPFGIFVWAAGQDRDTYDDFRIAGDEAVRSLDEIAPNELLNAMRYLAKTGVGISRDELVRETAALFGYSRMAAKTRGHLEAIVNHGVQRGRLHDDGSAIVVND